MPPLATGSLHPARRLRDSKVPHLPTVQFQSGILRKHDLATQKCPLPEFSFAVAQSGELGIQFQAVGIICLFFVFYLVFNFNSRDIIHSY